MQKWILQSNCPVLLLFLSLFLSNFQSPQAFIVTSLVLLGGREEKSMLVSKTPDDLWYGLWTQCARMCSTATSTALRRSTFGNWQ